jgi:hypothetical protein
MEHMLTVCVRRPGDKLTNFKGLYAYGAFCFLVSRKRTAFHVGTGCIDG